MSTTRRTGSAHLRTLARIQDQTGGFTEFVPLPFIHTNAPLYLAGVARPGPTRQENRAVHAMARIMLHGRIDNIQMLVGQARRRRLPRRCCAAGVNDLGGTLMEETISRMAGSEHGSAKTVADLHEIVDGLPGRRARQRTTTYGDGPGRAGRGRGALRRHAARRRRPRLLPLRAV